MIKRNLTKGMIYQLLTTLTIIIHFAFILFVIFGGLLALLDKRWIYYHLPGLAWGIIIEFTHWVCPLTPIENWFRNKANLSAYEGNFIDHYLSFIIYPTNLTNLHQIYLGTILIIINIAIYYLVWKKYRLSS